MLLNIFRIIICNGEKLQNKNEHGENIGIVFKLLKHNKSEKINIILSFIIRIIMFITISRFILYFKLISEQYIKDIYTYVSISIPLTSSTIIVLYNRYKEYQKKEIKNDIEELTKKRNINFIKKYIFISIYCMFLSMIFLFIASFFENIKEDFLYKINIDVIRNTFITFLILYIFYLSLISLVSLSLFFKEELNKNEN